MVDIFVFIGDVVDNVVCFVYFLRERGRGGRVVLVQPDQTLLYAVVVRSVVDTVVLFS